MTKPDPVEPPSLAVALMETTDGRTRCAISETEPIGLSIFEDDFTKLISRPKSVPVDDAPKVPATTPTTTASAIADLREIGLFIPRELGALHQGPVLNSLTDRSPILNSIFDSI